MIKHIDENNEMPQNPLIMVKIQELVTFLEQQH